MLVVLLSFLLPFQGAQQIGWQLLGPAHYHGPAEFAPDGTDVHVDVDSGTPVDRSGTVATAEAHARAAVETMDVLQPPRRPHSAPSPKILSGHRHAHEHGHAHVHPRADSRRHSNGPGPQHASRPDAVETFQSGRTAKTASATGDAPAGHDHRGVGRHVHAADDPSVIMVSDAHSELLGNRSTPYHGPDLPWGMIDSRWRELEARRSVPLPASERQPDSTHPLPPRRPPRG